MSEITASATTPFVKPSVAAVVPPVVVPEVPADTVGAPVIPVVAPVVAEVPVVPPVVADYAAIMQPYKDELSAKGSLSKESLSTLATALNAPLDVVELTYEGMKSRQQSRNMDILQAAGGEPTYLEMVQWATTVYTSEEAQAFNATLSNGSKEDAISAVGKLRERFTAVQGSPRSEVQKAQETIVTPVAPRAPVAAIVPYMNFESLRLAQKDKRYGTDPEYTAAHYARVNISRF